MPSWTLDKYLTSTLVSPLTKGVIYTIVRESPLMQKIPFKDIGDIQLMMFEADDLPVPGYRALNSSTVNEVSATLARRTETLKVLSNKIVVDRQFRDNKSNVVDPVAFQMEAYSKAIAYEVVDKFFNGDPDTNPDEPAGLIYRFRVDHRLSDGSPSPGTQRRVIDANNFGGDMTTANARAKLWDALHSAFSIMDGGTADCIVTNRQGVLAITAAARYGTGVGGFNVTQDAFGRKVMEFMGIPILDAGVKAAGAKDLAVSQQVIPYETGSQTNPWSNTIWVLKFGDTMLTGVQKRALEVIRKDPQVTHPFIEVWFEWVYGFHLFSPFSVVAIRRAF